MNLKQRKRREICIIDESPGDGTDERWFWRGQKTTVRLLCGGMGSVIYSITKVPVRLMIFASSSQNEQHYKKWKLLKETILNIWGKNVLEKSIWVDGSRWKGGLQNIIWKQMQTDQPFKLQRSIVGNHITYFTSVSYAVCDVFGGGVNVWNEKVEKWALWAKEMGERMLGGNGVIIISGQEGEGIGLQEAQPFVRLIVTGEWLNS